jgi:methenyltetrahydrofolate cyclohydrolase
MTFWQQPYLAGRSKTMSLQSSLQPFFNHLAGGDPTPGGGAAAATIGAMGAALVSMVCRLTIGRAEFAAVEGQLQNALTRAEALRAELTGLIDADAEAYNAVMAAYRLPKTTDTEKTARREAIQSALKQATLIPLDTARACAEVIELSQVAARLGNPNAGSDAAAGAVCAQAGLKAAALNVLTNLTSIKDEAFVTAHRAELDQLLVKTRLADEVYNFVGHR